MSMKAIFAIVALGSLVAMVHAGRLVIRPCSTDSPSLSPEVSLTSPNFTDGEDRPVLRRGQPYTLTITWTAATSTGALTTKVAAIIAGAEVPWNAINPSTCSYLISGECPFVTGQTYTYENILQVPALTPPMPSLTILWRFRLPDGRNEVCFELPAQITA